MKEIVVKKNVYGGKNFLVNAKDGTNTSLKTWFYVCATERGLQFKIQGAAEELYAPYTGIHPFEPVWIGDVMEVFLSPNADETWYFEFNHAPNGSCFYAKIYNPDGLAAFSRGMEEFDTEKKITVENGVWTTEFVIPYDVVVKDGDFEKAKGMAWSFNVYRIDHKNDEYLAFSPVNMQQVSFHVPSKFAKLIIEE